MTKWHNSDEGSGPCRAASMEACPFSGDSGDENHFDTQEEAQEAFEKKNEDRDSARLSKSKTPARTFSEEESKSLYALSNLNVLNAKHRKVVQDFSEGKKVTDKRLDDFIHHNRSLDYGIDSGGFELKEGTAAFKAIEAERNSRGTKNTMPTVDSFDPSTQTVFSQPIARKNPHFSLRALKKQLDSADWVEEVSERSAERSQRESDPEEADHHARASRKQYEDAREIRARADAMVKEIDWLSKNDSGYAELMKTTPLERIVNMRTARDYDYDAISGVKKAK